MKPSQILRLAAAKCEVRDPPYGCSAIRRVVWENHPDPTAYNAQQALIDETTAYLELFEPFATEVPEYSTTLDCGYFGNPFRKEAWGTPNSLTPRCGPHESDAQQHRVLALYMAADVAESERR